MSKILHMIDYLGLGGAQTVVKGVFESQFKNDNIFLYSLRKGKINTKINHKNVKVYDSTKKYSFKPLKELRHIIETEKIEVLHCHLFRSQVFGYILKKRYFPNVKLIMHEHGQVFQGDWYYNLFLSLAKKRTDLFIAVSQATKNKLIEKANIPEKKIKVLYNFVDLDKFNRKNIVWDIKEEKKKLGITDEFVIGFAGRLSKVKGCEYLLKSLPYLNLKYKCLVAGDGNLREDLKKLAKELKIEDRVLFLGYQENIIKVYSLFDILIVPSLSEACPMTLFEGYSMGLPIIASAVPSLDELMIDKKNGLLFEARNSKDLAEKIVLAHNKKTREKLKKNAKKNIEKYSLNKYIYKLNKTYDSLKNGN